MKNFRLYFARWRFRLLRLTLLLSLLITPFSPLALSLSHAANEEHALRSFTLEPDTTLEMSVPKTWKDQWQQAATGRPNLLFTPPKDKQFQLLIIPIWIDRPEIVLPGIEDIRRNVTSALEQARPQAIEATLTLKDVMSSYSRGYYFTAADRAPKTGEFKYMTQGMLRNGDLLLMFTLLTNEGDEQIIRNAVDMLKNSKLKAPARPSTAKITSTPKRTHNEP